MRTLVLWEFWGFYSSMELIYTPSLRRSFLVGEIFFNSRILRDHFLMRFPWLGLIIGHKIFPYILMRGGQVRPCQTRQRFAYPLSASFRQFLIPSIYSSRLVQVFVDLRVLPAALKWNRWLYPIVVWLWTCKWGWWVH